MQLVERHIINENHKLFKEIDNLSFLSKNLYNVGLYETRQYYFENKKFLNYIECNNKLVKTKNFDYYNLPTKVSQQTIKLVEQNFKSFFKLLKLKNDLKYRPPKYLKKDGRFILTYTIQSISKRYLNNNLIKLSGTNIIIKTKIHDISKLNCVRIIPLGNHYVIEVVYTKDEMELKQDNGRYCSIDLGINNLATIGSNVIKPIIINGKPLKSINQYYNKKLSKLKSHINDNGKSKSTKRIKRLHLKRNNKINDYLHKSSRYIINHLVSNHINTLIIGKNDGWKQEVNIGDKNNQNFVNIPHSKFINIINYKCKLVGINTIVNEESYTSKCSFLDDEEICKHLTYCGNRIKRGLFKSKNNKLINADLNGSLNIMKKVVGKFNYNPIEVCSTPLILSF